MPERLNNNGHSQLSVQEINEKYNVAEIMQKEKDAWKMEYIPNPPDALFKALERANDLGFTTFEPHYFPEKKFTKDSEWPGLGIK